MSRFKVFIYFLFLIPAFAFSEIQVGLGTASITPPIGTPSAGYEERKGEGMTGLLDPLLATALFIDNGEQKIIFCGVDHLGFTFEMSQEVIRLVQTDPQLAHSTIYVGSSHTHSGGGAYLNIPVIGEVLAGPYNPIVTKLYIDGAVEAILQAYQNRQLANIGIGYGHAAKLCEYRGHWPTHIEPSTDVMIIKVTKPDDTPLAVLFNYAMHPTVLKGSNRQFSADFIACLRQNLKIPSVFFNGAQGDIIPLGYKTQDDIGRSLAETVQDIWNRTETSPELSIKTQKLSYEFTPQSTPKGLKLPIDRYKSELNLIVLNDQHAFVTIPGELSTIYASRFKEQGKEYGFNHVSVLGLVNDAHGYIILPESWRHKTFESNLSFGGEFYGDQIEEKVIRLMQQFRKP